MSTSPTRSVAIPSAALTPSGSPPSDSPFYPGASTSKMSASQRVDVVVHIAGLPGASSQHNSAPASLEGSALPPLMSNSLPVQAPIPKTADLNHMQRFMISLAQVMGAIFLTNLVTNGLKHLKIQYIQDIKLQPDHTMAFVTVASVIYSLCSNAAELILWKGKTPRIKHVYNIGMTFAITAVAAEALKLKTTLPQGTLLTLLTFAAPYKVIKVLLEEGVRTDAKT